MVHSLPAAKNPRASLPGDQNGSDASSVSGMLVAVRLSRRRTQSRVVPSGVAPVKATDRPSGDTDIVPTLMLSGRRIGKRY